MKKCFPHPQSIVITGASSGIGAALAILYSDTGISLFLHGRDKARLDDVAQACRERGAHVHTALIDVREKESMQNWLEEADKQNPVDLVIANAGISGGAGQDGCESATQARMIFDVNVTGVFNTIEPLIPAMVERQRGQIGLMGSLASFSAWPGAPAYSASKAAVRIYAEALHSMLKDKGIGVSAICPGFIQTPMTAVNDYQMPFMMTAPQAAETIKTGLARNRPRIAFPFPAYLLAGFLGLLPLSLSKRIKSGLPNKPSL